MELSTRQVIHNVDNLWITPSEKQLFWLCVKPFKKNVEKYVENSVEKCPKMWKSPDNTIAQHKTS